MTAIVERTLERIAADIDRFGLTAVEVDLTAVVDHARRADIAPIAVDVLADRAEREIARARAFGIVATGLAQLGDQMIDLRPAVPAAL